MGRNKRSSGQSWEYWWEEFVDLAEDEEVEIDTDAYGYYKNRFFDMGDTPREALNVYMTY